MYSMLSDYWLPVSFQPWQSARKRRSNKLLDARHVVRYREDLLMGLDATKAVLNVLGLLGLADLCVLAEVLDRSKCPSVTCLITWVHHAGAACRCFREVRDVPKVMGGRWTT